MILVTAQLDQLDPNDKEQQKQREQLDFLLTMAQAKMAVYKAQLEKMFLDQKAVGSVPIVGNEALMYFEGYHANVSQQADQGIQKAINQFFTGSSDGIKSVFQELIKVNLNVLLGNTSTGELEAHQYYVIPEHNSIIRVDVKFWRYNFSSTGIIANCQNVFCYVFCKSVVDHTKLNIDEYIPLLFSEMGDNMNNLTKYSDEIRRILTGLRNQNSQDAYSNYVAASGLSPQG